MMAGTEEFISQMACTLCVKQPSLLYFLFSLESPACVRSAAQQSLGLCLCTAFERMIHLRTWPYLAEGDSRVPVFFFFFFHCLSFFFPSCQHGQSVHETVVTTIGHLVATFDSVLVTLGVCFHVDHSYILWGVH